MAKNPIVILHGWNLSASRFEPLIHELELRKFKVYCPDLPGFGSSKIPDKPLFLSDYASFLDRYLQSRKLKDSVIIGHSFGGRVGIKLVTQKPDVISCLILTGTPGINPVPRSKILFFIILAKFGKVIFSIPILSFLKNQARKFLYKFARASDFYNTDSRLAETFKNIVKEDLSSYLKDIKVPTLLLWGSQDSIVPITVANEMSKLIPRAQPVVISGARHGVPWTHPKLFVDEVENFLSKL